MIPSVSKPLTGTSEVIVTRVVDARPERVYAAWTRPELIQRWWRPRPEFSCLICEVDVRVGGKYRIGMGVTVPEHIAVGEYLEVIPDRRLVMSWSWEGPDNAKDTIVAVDFKPVGEKTEVTIHHKKLPSQKSADSHRGGWTGICDQLVTFLKAHS